jgi:hypothetical protein
MDEKKTEGRKSRATVPLRKIFNLNIREAKLKVNDNFHTEVSRKKDVTGESTTHCTITVRQFLSIIL